MTGTVLKVGERFPWYAQQPLPRGGTLYDYVSGQHYLQAFLEKATEPEVAAYREGPLELALVREGPFLFLCYRFPGWIEHWSDASFNWHRVPGHLQHWPEDIPDGQGALLSVILVNMPDRITRVVRLIAMGTAFSRALHQAIREQAQQPYDPAAYDQRLNQVYSQMTADMLQTRAIARWRSDRPEQPPGRVPRGKPR